MTDAEIELLIRRRAHELWEREGRPEGFALRHWLDAERRVREEVAHAAEMRETHAAGARDAATLSETDRFRADSGGMSESYLFNLSDMG